MKASELLIYKFPEETFPGGLVPPPQRPFRRAKTTTSAQILALPTFFSLSSIVSKPGDQGSRGTCATFAVSALAEHALNRNLSEQHLYFEAWNRYYAGNPAPGEGTSIAAVGSVLSSSGVCSEEDWAYDPHRDTANLPQGPLPTRVAASTKYRIRAIRVSSLATSASVAAANQIFATRSPVVLTLPVLSDAGWDSGFLIDVPTGVENVTGWHAVVAVGFNSVSRLMIIRNSWGPYWSINGYAAVSFTYIDRYAREMAFVD